MSKNQLAQDNVALESKILIKEHSKVAISSFIGTTIEWYDFYLYGTAAALVFPALFFRISIQFMAQWLPLAHMQQGSLLVRSGVWYLATMETNLDVRKC